MLQSLFEMRAAELALEIRIESEPGETLLQLARLRGIGQVCSGESIVAAHLLHRTQLGAFAP
jgi:hypothetical protein